jgi:urease accessory protein
MMLIERVIGNLDEFGGTDPAFVQVDWLDLTWRDCARRAVRGRTRAGRDVRILLPVGARLSHRDVLLAPPGSPVIAVNLRPAEVLVAFPRGLAEMGRLALELGNLHVPVEVRDAKVIVLRDGPTEAVLTRLGIPSRREVHPFVPEKCSMISLPMESPTLSRSYRTPSPAD